MWLSWPRCFAGDDSARGVRMSRVGGLGVGTRGPPARKKRGEVMKIDDLQRFAAHLRELGRIEAVCTHSDRFLRINIDDVEYFFALDGDEVTDYDGWGTTNVKKADDYLEASGEGQE